MTYNYNVNFTGSNYSAKDIENLARYATGVAITNKSDISAAEVLSYPLIPTAMAGFDWLKSNRKNLTGAMNTLKADSVFMNGVCKTAGVQGVLASSSASTILSNLPKAEQLAKMSESTQNLFNSAKAAAELAKGGSKDAIAKASQLFTEANAAYSAEVAASSTGILASVKNVLGINKLNAAVNGLAVKSPAFAKCFNAFKAQGGAVMLAIEGGVEAITNVIPTFKELGFTKGVKQLGKSAAKTVASVGGWVAGATVGTKVGAVIGSIIPGAGTAVGAVIGGAIGGICSLLGGSLLSRLAKNGAEKVVGKDELVIAQEEQAAAIAREAQNNNQVLSEVKAAAYEKLNQEGINSEDAQIAFNSLSSVTQQQARQAQVQNQTAPFQSRTAQEVYSMSNPFIK